MSKLVSAAEVLGHLQMVPLKEGMLPVEAIMVVKTIDEEGQPTWARIQTDGFNEMEMIGALTVLLRELEQGVSQGWGEGDD